MFQHRVCCVDNGFCYPVSTLEEGLGSIKSIWVTIFEIVSTLRLGWDWINSMWSFQPKLLDDFCYICLSGKLVWCNYCNRKLKKVVWFSFPAWDDLNKKFSSTQSLPFGVANIYPLCTWADGWLLRGVLWALFLKTATNKMKTFERQFCFYGDVVLLNYILKAKS